MATKHKFSATEQLFLCLTGFSVIFVLETIFKIEHLTILSLIFILFYFFIILFSKAKNNKSLSNSLPYIGLLLWTAIMLIHGFRLDGSYISNLFLAQYLFLPFTLPFAIRCFSVSDIKRVLLMIHYINIIYFVFILVHSFYGPADSSNNVSFSEILNKFFVYPNFLLLFSIKILPRKMKLLSIIVFFIGLFIAVINGRRGMAFTIAVAGILSIILYFLQTNISLIKRIFYYAGIVLLFVGFYIFYIFYQQEVFGKLMDRIGEDTRGAVSNDFYRDMTAFDYIVGRGIGGTYTVRDFTQTENLISNQRDGIENGFLDIVLRGGYVYLILLLIIYVIAMYRGFFKSNNILAKAFASFILLHIIELYPSGNLSFNVRYLLIWFSIAMCYKNEFLRMSDIQVMNFFKESNLKRNNKLNAQTIIYKETEY